MEFDLPSFMVLLRTPVILVSMDTRNWYCCCQLDSHSVLLLDLLVSFTISVVDARKHPRGYGFILHHRVPDAWVLWVDGWAFFNVVWLPVLLDQLLLSLSERRASSIKLQVQLSI